MFARRTSLAVALISLVLIAMLVGVSAWSNSNRGAARPISPASSDEPPLIDPDASAPPAKASEPTLPPPRTSDVVVWISLDGLRSDYLARTDAPLLNRLKNEGVHTLALEPIFPAITFPSHVALATGVGVSQHGVPSNTFYDSAAERVFAYPAFGTLLGAEPIWLTAARQNVRVLVHDWPLSHGQRGEVTAAYFEPKFDTQRSDDERLALLLKTWREDTHETPLRLIMGYVVGTDKIGHERGPDAPETLAAMRALDDLLARFVTQAIAIFEAQRQGDAQLYLVFTTDHGMAPVTTLVHLGLLAEVEGIPGIRTQATGNVGDIFFAETLDKRAEQIAAVRKRLEGHAFGKAYLKEQLPAEWEYAHPTRVGDIVFVLKQGHSFSRSPKTATAPVTEKGPLGMHGYDPAKNPQMLGPAIFWRYPKALSPRTIDRIGARQIHPTICALLGIEPSAKAKAAAVEIEPR